MLVVVVVVVVAVVVAVVVVVVLVVLLVVVVVVVVGAVVEVVVVVVVLSLVVVFALSPRRWRAPGARRHGAGPRGSRGSPRDQSLSTKGSHVCKVYVASSSIMI